MKNCESGKRLKLSSNYELYKTLFRHSVPLQVTRQSLLRPQLADTHCSTFAGAQNPDTKPTCKRAATFATTLQTFLLLTENI